LASTVGAENPYRYRGYRYDTETGLYYLQSRYYNPEWGRFINADGIVGNQDELLSCNMFAYCNNNPVNLQDEDGNWPSFNDIIQGAKNVISNVVNTIVKHVVAAIITTVAVVSAVVGIDFIMKHPQTLPAIASEGAVASKVADKANEASTGISKVSSVVTKGLNFTKTTESRMENPGRFVPVQTLQKAIEFGIKEPDPRGSEAMMHYTTMFKNGSEYNLEVLYNEATNTIYHFEYTRKAIGPMLQILKK
jgi:RHS repeat-associated protein